MSEVTIFENSNFQVRSSMLVAGGRRFFGPDDLNDMTSSLRVPAGMVAIVHEHANDQGGYGLMANIVEDCADRSAGRPRHQEPLTRHDVDHWQAAS